jgi:L-ascorbate metabolism protein UlaG (beta-lactamase superfamily)
MGNRPYHHRPDGRFRNPAGSPERDAPVSDYVRFFARRATRANQPGGIPEGHVLPAEQARDAWARGDGADRLLWLGHAGFLLQVAGTTILIDPFLSPNAGPGRFGPKRFAAPGLPVELLPPVDVLLITHNHYDHLDTATIARLARRDRIEVIAPLGLGPYFAGRGFGRITQVDWYGTEKIGDLTITALPAIHWSKRGIADECRSLWCGYAIETPDYRLCFCGDTGYGPVFGEIGARMGGFDLALMGIGAYEPRRVMHASHANPEEAARIARELRAREVFGMHWGAIVLSDEPPFEPPVRFRAAALQEGFDEETVWRLAVGESRPLIRGAAIRG